jgi:hypothetical protein
VVAASVWFPSARSATPRAKGGVNPTIAAHIAGVDRYGQRGRKVL